MKIRQRQIFVLGLTLLLLVTAGCAPGSEEFKTELAGFWAGLWHGLICIFTLVIGLFKDSVHMYEVNNTGGWYDFGFLLGVAAVFSSSYSPCIKSKRAKSIREKEWNEIGVKVEGKVRKGIKSWLEESEKGEKEWEEIGRKIEDKIKNELRNWAEK